MNSDQHAQVQAAHDSYGSENDQNGVTVGIKLNGDPGGTLLKSDGTISVQFRDDVSDFKGVKSFAAEMAHEGQHVADAQAFIAHPFIQSPWDLNHYERETRAYDTGAYAAQALGFSTYPPHSEMSAWERGWKEADRAKRIAFYVRKEYDLSLDQRYSEEQFGQKGGTVKWVP